MKKNFVKVFLLTCCIVFILSGCSSKPNEEKVMNDLSDFSNSNLISNGEKIDSLKIYDSKSEGDTYIVECVVVTEKNDVSYEKKVDVTYKKSKEWQLSDVNINNNSEWKIEPLKGVDKNTIESDLEGEELALKNEEWEIEKGDIIDLAIANQNTDLKNKRDKITLDITLDGVVENAKGTIVVEYEFDKEWKLKGTIDASDVIAEIKDDKKLDMSESALIDSITKQTFEYGAKKNDDSSILMISGSTIQNIPIEESEITEFRINEQSSQAKGTVQVIECSATIAKKYATFLTDMKLTYTYNSDGYWNEPTIATTANLESLDIVGEWTGKYTEAGSTGIVSLNIAEVNDDVVSGTYSYTPDKINRYRQAGCYSFSGTIDKETLMLYLKAGEWITKPERVLSTDKVDISAFINLCDEVMEGKGHGSAAFKLSK